MIVRLSLRVVWNGPLGTKLIGVDDYGFSKRNQSLGYHTIKRKSLETTEKRDSSCFRLEDSHVNCLHYTTMTKGDSSIRGPNTPAKDKRYTHHEKCRGFDLWVQRRWRNRMSSRGLRLSESELQ